MFVYLDVFSEVFDSFVGSCIGQVVVDPFDKQVLRREGSQVLQRLPVLGVN